MAENETLTKKKRFGLPPLAIVSIGIALVGLAGFWLLDRASKRPAPPPPPLTGEAKAYARNLKLTGVGMQKHESYLGQSVVEITGNIGNIGDRALKTVEINLVFYDPYQQVVLRARRAIVDAKMHGLAPGETKPFRLAFDDIPEDWNQAGPQLVIAAIAFS